MEVLTISNAAKATLLRDGIITRIVIEKHWHDIAAQADCRETVEILLIGDPEIVDARGKPVMWVD